MAKTVTIFGSSLPKPGELEYENAYQLAFSLSLKGFNICSGGYMGIMDAVSKGASDGGTESIGITVENLFSTPSKYLSKNIITSSLLERLQKLTSIADGFIALPGGTGTMLELSLVWEYVNKSIMDDKPIAVLGNFWNSIIDTMEARIRIENRKSGLVKKFDTVEEIANYFAERLI